MSASKPIKIIALLAVVLAAMVHFYPINSKTGILKTLDKGKSAIEDKNLSALLPLISLDYKDEMGFNKLSLRRGFEEFFSRFHAVQLQYRILHVRIENDTCTAEIELWARSITPSGPHDMAGKEAQYLPVTFLFEKKMLKWKVFSTKWPRGLPEVMIRGF